MAVAPSARRLSPSARRRSRRTDRGRRAPERAAGIGRREARYATRPCHPDLTVPAHSRHGRAGCASAYRRRGRAPTLVDDGHWQTARHPPAGPATGHGRSAFRPPRTPIRTPAVRAKDHGRRAAERGEVSSGAPAPRCRPSVGIPATWPPPTLLLVQGRPLPHRRPSRYPARRASATQLDARPGLIPKTSTRRGWALI